MVLSGRMSRNTTTHMSKRPPTRQSGFSLLELLVSVAIIGILLALYSGALSKAMRYAKTTAAAESMHQSDIMRRLGKEVSDPIDAYRRTIEVGKDQQAIITEMAYVVENDAEFRAYWNTLIAPNYTGPIEFEPDGALRAIDPEGNVFILPRISVEADKGGSFIIAWDFFSTDLKDTALGNLGSNVLYSDGRVKYVKYKAEFPVTETVARLSRQYMLAYE